MKPSPEKITRMKDVYLKEVLPGHVPLAHVAKRFGFTPAGMKYQLRKANVFVEKTR